MYSKKMALLIMALVTVNLTACATYYSHYGAFEAQNSKGEVRQFKVYWETEEYPSWYFEKNQASPITLSTQCSTRKWQFRDPSFGSRFCDASADGIVSCGDPSLDLTSDGLPVPNDHYVCARITDAKSAKHIADLRSQIEITMKCWPSSTEYKDNDKTKNRDYLKQSEVAYTISTRKVPRFSMLDNNPELSDRVCKKD
jgi:hypothetical protein